MVFALLILFPAIPAQAEEEITPPLVKYEWGKPVSLETTEEKTPDFEVVLTKLREQQKQEEAEKARIAELERLRALENAQQYDSLPQTPNTSYTASPQPKWTTQSGNGYIMAGNNCVECVYRMTGRKQSGNAGQWRPSSSTPWIGAIMIWYGGEQGASSAGHVGVVQGINSDGTVDIAHCNWYGGQTRFRSTGKFW